MLIGGEPESTSAFGSGHPLSIPRMSTVLSLCRALCWLEPGEWRESPQAGEEELARLHDREYIAALRAADAAAIASIEVRERFGIGTRENPLFPGVFARAAAAVGGSILAAELALEGYLVFHPAGGTHHGRPGRASGFCYFNDPLFALHRLAQAGLTRILYVDLDAHHCDAVEDGVRDDWRMHTISIHQAGRWPHTGGADDRGGGRSRNYPVPAGFHDDELHYLMRTGVLPYADALDPEAVVITCGADALAGDPLTGLNLSNVALWDTVGKLAALAPAAVVLGGGGYNPWTVARCWTGLWGRLSGRRVPRRLPQAAVGILRGLSCELIDDEAIDPAWLSTLADREHNGAIREPVLELTVGPAMRTGTCE